MAQQLYIHSKCCNAHWELSVKGKKFELSCEKCGRSVGKSIKVVGPDMTKAGCVECQNPN